MTFSTDTHPRARTEHQCNDCHRTIRPGETYRRGVVMDGTAWTWKECVHCEVLIDWLYRSNEVWDGEDYGPDTFADWEPRTLSDLRLKANWRRKWTRRDGSLVPIPTEVMGETPDC